jgi:hypothetical protein
MNVYEAATLTNFSDLPRAISLKVQQRVTTRGNALNLALKHLESSDCKNKLMGLARTTIYNQHSLVCILVPREDLSSRVNECRAADVVVADVYFRVAAVKCERGTVGLRYSNITQS